jgi:hypothetical protein
MYESSVKIYDIKNILFELNVSFNNFKQICILSGTDYNLHGNKYNLSRSIYLFNQYQECINVRKNKITLGKLGFIEWIINNVDSGLNYDLLCKIYNMFDMCDKNKLIQFKNALIMNNE